MESKIDYKTFTIEDFEKAFDEHYKIPKPGDKDYYGYLGNGMYQIGTMLTGQGGWDMYNEILKKGLDGNK